MSIHKTATALLVLAVAAGSSVQGEISERIFEGRVVKRGEIPYMVDLNLYDQQNQVQSCGGALISTKWVLSTATCVTYNGYGEVMIGQTKRGNISGVVTQDLTPSSIFHPHPKFNANTKENDIGLIELPTAVSLSDYPYIMPIDLPSKSMNPASYFDNYNASISGWGRYNPGNSRSRDLRSAFVTVMKKADCVSKMASYPNKPYPLTDNELCAAKDPSVHKYGACVGDYGGPLAVQNPSTGKPMLVGVMSFTANGFTNGRCYNEFPGISTFVVPYLPWISQITGIPVS